MIGPYILNENIGDRYVINAFIGEGGMQYVYRATDRTLNREVALKTPKSVSSEKRFHKSAIVAAKVNHPNVAKTLDYFDYNERPHLIEELVDGGDLDAAIIQKVQCVDPYLAAKIFHHLSKGIAASHHAGVVHRDLKPSNVMIKGGIQLDSIKITDFGIAKMAEEEIAVAAEQNTISASSTAFGALPYMSPESIQSPRQASKSADIWSLGAMMFELLTGTKPFGSGLIAAHNIVSGKLATIPTFLFSNLQFSVLCKQIMDVINQCLMVDPAARPSADQLSLLCSSLCYPLVRRYTGRVKRIDYESYGFIICDGASDVFFNLDSVYGNAPTVGDRVMLSRFPGGKADRAHPIVLLK